MEQEYIPGTCNIGPQEIRRRYAIGYTGIVLVLVIFLLLEWTDAPRQFRLLVFPPLFYTFSGFIQAKRKFCYFYGWRGVFSITGRKQIQSVEGIRNRRKDRLTALALVSLTTLLSFLFTMVYYFV